MPHPHNLRIGDECRVGCPRTAWIVRHLGMQRYLLAGWKPAQSNRDWRINERLRGLDLKMVQRASAVFAVPHSGSLGVLIPQAAGRRYPPSSLGMKKTSEPGRSGWK